MQLVLKNEEKNKKKCHRTLVEPSVNLRREIKKIQLIDQINLLFLYFCFNYVLEVRR